MRAVHTPERDRELDSVRKERYAAKHPGRALYRHLKRRADAQGQWTLDIDRFAAWYDKQPKECAYCGMWEDHAKEQFGHRLHVDRKDPDQGYTAGNMCLACHRCNVTKSRYLTHEQMKDAAQRYFLGMPECDCNAHDELVAALREIAEFDAREDSQEGFNEWGEAELFNRSQEIARAALAKAGA